MLADKEICDTFKISQYQLRKWKNECTDYTSISSIDFIYGALRSLGKQNITQIANYISHKNRTDLPDKEIQDGLKKLIDEGLAYEDKGLFNYTQRLIEVYSNKTDKLVDEVELAYFDLAAFRAIFKTSSSDYLMYDQFEITIRQSNTFVGIVTMEFDLKNFCYYLTARQGQSKQ